jgi:hypothetical protein
MNIDKIKELEKSATEEHKSHDCWGKYEPNYVLNTTKFAELIIKECLQQCVHAIESCDEEIHPYYVGAQRAKENIEYEFEIKL